MNIPTHPEIQFLNWEKLQPSWLVWSLLLLMSSMWLFERGCLPWIGFRNPCNVPKCLLDYLTRSKSPIERFGAEMVNFGLCCRAVRYWWCHLFHNPWSKACMLCQCHLPPTGMWLSLGSGTVANSGPTKKGLVISSWFWYPVPSKECVDLSLR